MLKWRPFRSTLTALTFARKLVLALASVFDLRCRTHARPTRLKPHYVWFQALRRGSTSVSTLLL